MTPERQKAMQAGKERAQRKARKEAVQRVKDYRAWLKADVAHTQKLRKHESGIGRHPGSRPRMPAIPSSYDFQIADGRA